MLYLQVCFNIFKKYQKINLIYFSCILSIKNFNTPAISELKEQSVTLILQAEKYGRI